MFAYLYEICTLTRYNLNLFLCFVCWQHCNDNIHNCQSDMNIVGAWKRGYTGKDVVVTILDDGIERNHPDLIQNYVSSSRLDWATQSAELNHFVL